MDRSQAADSAFLTDLYLQEPLDFLESLEGDLKDTVARCFEQVYHAGKHSVRSFSPKAFMTESAYEMEDGQNRKKPRKQWTAKALNFFKEKGREAKWWEVLEHLREKNIAHWEGGDGGNCEVRDTQVITFEDGETEDKSRKQFQNALTKLRKKIPPKAKG